MSTLNGRNGVKNIFQVPIDNKMRAYEYCWPMGEFYKVEMCFSSISGPPTTNSATKRKLFSPVMNATVPGEISLPAEWPEG